MEEESKNLLPTVDVPDFVDEEEDEEYDVDYKPSPMWDLEKGDFVRTAANNVPMNDGYEAYKIWCVKTVSTERYSCLGYSDDHGTETEDITREYLCAKHVTMHIQKIIAILLGRKSEELM